MFELDITEEQLNGDIIALFLSTVSNVEDFITVSLASWIRTEEGKMKKWEEEGKSSRLASEEHLPD